MSAQPHNVLPLRDTEPVVSVVSVTPETAKRWLARNDNNRRMREATVLKYARDMAAGRWQITGESIKFDTDGRLLDGQQRLAAIARSGVTIQLVVMRGIPAAAQRVMDTGRARTSSDALTMQGEANSAQIDTQAAIAFWTSAADKVGLPAGDPVIALTNRFAEARRNREHLMKRTLLSLTYRAWNARRAGKTMRFIRVNSPAGGLVPIPDPH